MPKRTAKQKLSVAQRQRQALELKLAGATYQDIADSLGYRSRSGAQSAVDAALKKVIKEPAEKLRQVEVARLDKMLLAIWQQVKQGNHGAIDRAIRIMDRRAKLLGLDMPARFEVYDWRKDAERLGLDASEIFEQMVNTIVEKADND